MRSADMRNARSRPNLITSSAKLPQHLQSLQWLRGLAALAVVYFHAVVQIKHFGPNIDIPVTGSTGVDIFFVLSGFIMWVTTCNTRGGIKRFLLKRVRRIAPLYWLLSIVVSLCAIATPHLLNSTRFDPVHLIASLLFIPWPNPAKMSGSYEYLSPVIIPGWTLNMEMAFYLLFAFCLPFRKRGRVVSICILITALYVSGVVGAGSALLTSFYGDSIIFEFLMGILLAAYVVPFLRLSATWAWGLLAIALVVLFSIEQTALDLPRAVKFGIPAFVAIAAAINLERLSAIPNRVALVALGDASYSIYLSHLFVLAGLRVVAGILNIPLLSWTAAWMFIAIGMVASAALGLVLHKYVEKPLAKLNVKRDYRENVSGDTAPQH